MSFTDIFGSNKPRCQGFKEDGSRCKTDPQTGNKFCFMHDPTQKEKRTEARRKGGEARSQLYPRKIPPTFHYQSPKDHAQLEALFDQLALYYERDEIDLRSARFYCYIAIGKLALWNSLDRLQSKATRDAERQARILRREKDPWSPHYGALARAAKEKEEAEKAAKSEADLSASENEASAMPSDVALSFRELEELKQQEEQKEEARKEKERERARPKLGHWSENEDRRTGPLILGTSTISETQSRANRARAGAEPTGSEHSSESAPPKRPPQAVRNNEDEQRQQRIMQSDMNELTERMAEKVRAEAYKKGEWRRKRRW